MNKGIILKHAKPSVIKRIENQMYLSLCLYMQYVYADKPNTVTPINMKGIANIDNTIIFLFDCIAIVIFLISFFIDSNVFKF